MTGFPDFRSNPDGFAASVLDRLDHDKGVRRAVPTGWLHIDRPLPFLCVYRHPVDGGAVGTERLVQSQASHLVVSDDPELGPAVRNVVSAISGALGERFGTFLVLELWTGSNRRTLRIEGSADAFATTVPALAESLKRIDVLGRPAAVETSVEPNPAPHGRLPLLTVEDRRRLGVQLLGVEMPPFFVDEEGRPYPLVLRRLQGETTTALQRALFEFATLQTSHRPEDFRALGTRRIGSRTRRVDAALTGAARGIDYLLAVTPVDTDLAWDRFNETDQSEPPTFHYRPLTIDPDLKKRELYAVPVEEVEDPTLAALFRAKRHELERQVNLVEDRGSDSFVHTSLQLFGGVDAGLLTLAEGLLERLDLRSVRRASRDHRHSAVDAAGFAARARAEVSRYRAVDPDVTLGVTVRADVPGVLVSGGELLVGSQVTLPEVRVDALIQHEIGTHWVTEVNGRAQPLNLLCAGLPDYEETQEGLAVLAEFVAGGLTRSRLATLAARVVAVERLVAGASFLAAYRELHDRWGLAPRRSFLVAMRVYRAGGLTKDAIYLRGLDGLLAYLADGGSIDPLLCGKLPLHDVPVVEELQWRGVLKHPRLRPHWLDAPGAAERMQALTKGMTVLDLVEETVQ